MKVFKKIKFNKKNPKCLGIFLMFLGTFSSVSIAALPSKSIAFEGATVNTVKGRAPSVTFNAAQMEKKLGFKFDNKIFNGENTPDFSPQIGIVKLNEVEPDLQQLYEGVDYRIDDADGDASTFGNKLNLSDLKLTWFSNGNRIPEEDLNVESCKFDLEKYSNPVLKVSAIVTGETPYGNPVLSEQASFEVDYNISILCPALTGKILYVKPLSLKTDGTGRDVNFVAEHGFTPDAGFPTMGFHDASFTLELEGNPAAALYELYSSDEKVAVIDTNNNILLRGRGNATIHIRDVKTQQEVSSYSFRVRQWYVKPKLTEVCAIESPISVNKCDPLCFNAAKENVPEASSGTIPLIENLTNAKGTKKGHRELGSLFGEWGNLKIYNGNKSLSNMITKSATLAGSYESASATDGRLSTALPTTILSVICKAEYND